MSCSRATICELEDLPDFPSFLRRLLTDFLGAIFTYLPLYDQAAGVLAEILSKTSCRSIVDLCSGSAGPWARILPKLEEKLGCLELYLTDRFPTVVLSSAQFSTRKSMVHKIGAEVDARKIPSDLRGLRTFFTSFHHFSPKEASSIIGRALAQGHGIAVFEITGRSLRFWPLVLLTPLWVWLLSWRIRPLTFERIFWTYVIPAVPVIALIDGIISLIRSYSADELRWMLEQIALECRTPFYGCVGVAKTPLSMEMTYLFAYPLAVYEQAQAPTASPTSPKTPPLFRSTGEMNCGISA